MIEVAPLAFMRGRTLNDAFIIVDEAQNTTPEQMKMVLTRLGFGSKMVVTGDITQVDLPKDQRSGLVVIGDILDDVEGIEFVRFGGEDVVRHKLVQRIVAAYSEYAEQAGARAARRRAQEGLIEVEVDRRRRGAAAPAGAAALAAAGVDEGHLAVALVDAERDPRAEPRAPRPRPAHRRALVPGGRGRPRRRPARARRRGDLPRAHRRTWTEAVVHGVLHLCGYDHETDAGEMLALQDRVMAGLR